MRIICRSRRAITPLVTVGLAVVLPAVAASPASAAPTVWWALASEQAPTHLEPGGEGRIFASATAVGGGVNATHSPVTITDVLPPGLEATAVEWTVGSPGIPQWPTELFPCTIVSQAVSCTLQPLEPFLPVAALEDNLRMEMAISVRVHPDAGAPGEANEVSVSGGEPLVCQAVAPETGGFVDGACHGMFPFQPSEAFSTLVENRDFEQQEAGETLSAAHLARPVVVSEEPVPFGVDQYEFSIEAEGGAAERHAGAHPFQLTTSFVLNEQSERRWDPAAAQEVADSLPELPRDARFELPTGLIGNPTAVPRCSAADFYGHSTTLTNDCPADTAVGIATVTFVEPIVMKFQTLPLPLFNLEPSPGEPARFGFSIGTVLPVVLDTSVRSGGDYGVTVTAQGIPEVSALLASRATFWGEPGDPRHDSQRGWSCVAGGFYRLFGMTHLESLPSCSESQGSSGTAAPVLRLPTSCSEALSVPMRLRSWRPEASYLAPVEPAQPIDVEACNRLPFDPQIEVRPDVHAAATPSGLRVRLHLPQEASEVAGGLAEADLKDAVVTLPEGVIVNPSSASGLASCAPEQIELHGPEPARCPDASKIGSVEIETPLLKEPLSGGVYVAKPHDNPFGSLLAIYIAVDDSQSGVVVKLAGEVTADPQTGRLTARFSENPQLPFEDFKLSFFGGPRAALKTPDLCGAFSTAAEMTPWSENGDAHPSDSFAIESGPNGSSCAKTAAEQPHAPGFEAGSINPIAGAYSPFLLNLTREDGSQTLEALKVTPPPGLLGRLAGVSYCPEAALAAAAGKTGAEEQAAPSCPAASRVGAVTVGAGAGSSPYRVKGQAYLAGPYKGAPLSLAVVTPAVAGPYDLGTVVVRSALHVDPETAQVTVESDPLPTILEGIPLDIRSISLRMDRPSFTRNPTSCEATSVGGEAISALGQTAPLSSRFQVGACRALDFKPRLRMRLLGKTNRGAHPGLRAVLTMPKGNQANIARTAVTLPPSEFLDNAHLRNLCTRAQFAEAGGGGAGCPQASVYGYAKAWSPLLDRPLAGPVYLRTNPGNRSGLPDLVASLSGQIHIDLVGRIDRVAFGGDRAGIRTTFAAVPDAPVSRFVLTMKGGSKGLLQNSENICAGKHRATVRTDAHNGAIHDIEPLLGAACGKARARLSARGKRW